MLNAELTLKKSCLEIRVINQLTSRTQHSGCGDSSERLYRSLGWRVKAS